MEDDVFDEGHGTRPLCGANKRQGEGTCRRPAGAGTDHLGAGRCGKHGGATPAQTVKASKELVLRGARDAVRKLGYQPVENPYLQLQLVAGELVAVKDMLRAEVERLDDVRYEGRSGEQVRGELLAYQAALRDTAGVLTAMTRLKIDEHLIRIREAQAELVIAAIEAALSEAGVRDPILRQRAKLRAARLLRGVEGEAGE